MPSVDALVIATLNPKGGTGKTTLAVHLARAAQLDGLDVVIIDTDPQGSATDWRRRAADVDAYDAPPVVSVTDASTLRSDLSRLVSSYDVAVIDGAAKLQGMTGAILAASDAVLIPVQASALDLWGTAEFIDLVTDRVHAGGTRAAFVPSARDVRTTLSAEVRDVLEDAGGDDVPVFDGTTRRVAYARSLAEGKTALDGYDATAADEITQLLTDTGQLLQ
ncbi:ParA family partition ATPase [Longibacter salinarum]|nr:ParA family partition ATPase [Longibacter salinarum]